MGYRNLLESPPPGSGKRSTGLAAKAAWVQPLLYGALNIASASGIVFANKVVFSTYGFRFTCALTWIHTMFTLAAMRLLLAAGAFQHKRLAAARVLPLAAAYVGYIVLCNLSLNVNTVGFYQVMKIAVAPTVILLELLLFRTVPPLRVVLAVLLVCLGIGIATVTDAKIVSNLFGLGVGLAATLVTAVYQIFAGSKQKELGASSMQLLHQYTPQAAVLLGLLVPVMEPVGRPHGSDPATLLGYRYTPAAVTAIVISSLLGVLVTVSTFQVIRVSSSLTYNVVGHVKTVLILTGGCLMFGDDMPPKKLLGVCVAMCGIIWYTHLKLTSASSSPPASHKAGAKGASHAGEAAADVCAAIDTARLRANGAVHKDPGPVLRNVPSPSPSALLYYTPGTLSTAYAALLPGARPAASP